MAMVGFTKLCHENALLGAANQETNNRAGDGADREPSGR